MFFVGVFWPLEGSCTHNISRLRPYLVRENMLYIQQTKSIIRIFWSQVSLHLALFWSALTPEEISGSLVTTNSFMFITFNINFDCLPFDAGQGFVVVVVVFNSGLKRAVCCSWRVSWCMRVIHQNTNLSKRIEMNIAKCSMLHIIIWAIVNIKILISAALRLY